MDANLTFLLSLKWQTQKAPVSQISFLSTTISCASVKGMRMRKFTMIYDFPIDTHITHRNTQKLFGYSGHVQSWILSHSIRFVIFFFIAYKNRRITGCIMITTDYLKSWDFFPPLRLIEKINPDYITIRKVCKGKWDDWIISPSESSAKSVRNNWLQFNLVRHPSLGTQSSSDFHQRTFSC